MRAALADRHFGRLLRAYRLLHEPPIRQITLAGLLGVTQGHLSYMERASHRVADLDKLERWARTIQVPPRLLWFTLPEQCSDPYDVASDGPKLPPVEATTGEDVRRRQFIRSAGAGAATIGLTLLTGGTAVAADRVGMVKVDDVRKMTRAFRETDNEFGGGATRSGLDNYLTNTVEPMLRDTRMTDAVKKPLFRAGVELRQLAGWVAYDVGHASDGRKHLREALNMSQEIEDDALVGEMFAAMSHHAAFRGNSEGAVDLALAAQQAARRSGIPALEAEAAVMEAHGRALEREQRPCLDALNRAERAFARVDTGRTPTWLAYFDSSYLAAKFAHTFRDIGMPAEAERFARRSLRMTEGYGRGRLFNTALLASTLADQQKVEEACAEARNAVRLATNVRSVRAASYLADVGRRLSPHSQNAQVQALYKQLDDIGVATPRF
ncbi:helix-turn-helix domain-containing protein [Amycolatopsis dendrobii]|uniref:helix-turn-helix domain-containing protein n=1 Tax=Amycolatopsis dendrobii TaxID=2760662 RepID=UPI0028A8FBF8|nr:helix-turn-helix domain-containing protein [Amycolatopsis dendrobii]